MPSTSAGFEQLPMSPLNIFKQIGVAAADNRLIASLIAALDRHSENRMTELGMIAQAFEFARLNGVRGDYFEFGLWRGRTFRYAHRMKGRYGLTKMMLWGFDSFQGLPETSEKKDNIWLKGQYSNSEEGLRRALKRAGFRDSEFELIAGFYSESLNEELHRRMNGRVAAVVYVDCDLYESTRDALRFTERYLVNGSIVCFDDFYCFKASPDHGEQRALREFLETAPSLSFLPYFNYGTAGASFIVRRQAENSPLPAP
jgi:O-methyltransferase